MIAASLFGKLSAALRWSAAAAACTGSATSTGSARAATLAQRVWRHIGR